MEGGRRFGCEPKSTYGVIPESTPPALHSELHAVPQEMDGGAAVTVAWLVGPVTTKDEFANCE